LSLISGSVRFIRRASATPRATVIIPSRDGHRAGNVGRLIEDIERQTLEDFELLLVIGVSPNGRARNVGAEQARGHYLIFIDDDVRLGHQRVLEQLVDALQRYPEFGLVGPSQQIPTDSTWLQLRMAEQLPRTRFPVVEAYTESDMVSHLCLALRREVWDEVGGESDTLIRGTDPDLRLRVRQAGYRVVVVPRTWAYHPMPGSLRELLRAWFSAGAGSAEVFLNSPDLVIDAPDSFQETASFQRPFRRRIIDASRRVLKAAVCAQEIRLLCQCAYGLGYVIHVLNRKAASAATR